MIKNIISSYSHIPYTLKHYFAFMKLQKKLIGVYRYKFHDLDKILMYSFLPFLGTKRIKKIHSRINKHHILDKKNRLNYEEAVLDWECARFTKPDKPETAREQTMKRWKDTRHYTFLIKELEKFGL